MKLITITGIDKSGKTTLIERVSEETNFQHYILDRDPSTYCFFNNLQHRWNSPKYAQVSDYIKFSDKFKKIVDLAIFIRANPEDITNRFRDHNEGRLVGDLNIIEHQNEIERYFDYVEYPNTLKLNTSTLNINECVEEILRKLNAD